MTPYEILRVPNDASLEQIKAAFHRRAKETHPDTNPNNPNAAEEFNKVVEAYNILSDSSSRNELDEMLQAGSYNDSFTSEDFNHSEGFSQYSAVELQYVINELRRQAQPAKNAAAKYSMRGTAWLIGGLLVTGYSIANGAGVLAWGAILFGVIQSIRGFKAYLDINSELNRLEKHIWDVFMSQNGSHNYATYDSGTSSLPEKDSTLRPEGNTQAIDTLSSGISNSTNTNKVKTGKSHSINKKTVGIIAGIVALVLIFAGGFYGLNNRSLSVKEGPTKSIYTGDEETISFEGGGIDESDYPNVVITESLGKDSGVISIDKNVVKALKPGSVKLDAVLKKGLSTYKGSFTIKVENRTIGFNEPNTINMYEGDSHEIDIDLSSIPEDKVGSIEWTVQDDNKIVKVENTTITALKMGSTSIRAHLEDDGRIYEGLLSVKVDAKPVDFYTGEIVKGYSGIAPIKVTAPSSDDVYVYLKGFETDDFSFLVKRGETANVNAPTGSYLLCFAYGKEWYGKDSLFGKSGSYYMNLEQTKLYSEGSYAYGFQLDLSSKPSGMSTSYEKFPR